MTRSGIARGMHHALGLAVLCVPLAGLALPLESRVPGGIALLPLGKVIAGAAAPRAWLGDQAVWVTQEKETWVAVVGIGLDTPVGEHELRVSDTASERRLRFGIKAKRYPEQHITLKDSAKVILSAEDETRALAEIPRIQEIKRHWRETPSSDDRFSLPAEGRLSGNFGRRRFFNGEARAPHSGIDLAVPRGTPVKANAAGVVLAVDDYFFNGKTIFIDHGNGLITMVCHLDLIDVVPGTPVARGQAIGRSGMTGRASGPHLHWSVALNGVMVDPTLFLGSAWVDDPGKKTRNSSTKRP